MSASSIVATVDYEKDGIQHGFLRLPYSRDESAWGSIMIPITSARNGDGPTALLTGGNHGDEYEGPIALFDLAQSIEPTDIQGRVIIVPAMNYPAVRVARRTSPLDGGNLNRLFPGRPDGTVTEKIAHYFDSVLLPKADIVLDIHSGGRSLDFLPFAAVHQLDDNVQQARCEAAMEAFGAPYSMLLLELDNKGMYDSAAEEKGKVFLSTELGGGGTSRAATVGIAKRGVRDVLRHAGILSGELEPRKSVRLNMPGDECYLISQSNGLVEPCQDLGGAVKKGDPIARIWPIERSGIMPSVYEAPIDGLLAARHFPGLIQTGDCLAVIGVPDD